MKLIECYVSSFGKLKNYKYNFNDALNVINEQNGFGKTTFSIFIKSMFYGLDDSKRSIEDNERKKYKPWNSTEKFGGYIIFEKNDKKYKLERFFGAKESDDEGKLTELETGRIFSDVSNVGNKIFAVDSEGFLSTTYFSQKDFNVQSNSSLTAKFNSVCDVQDSQAFDKALLTIKEKIKSFNYSGDRGLIPQLNRDIFAVEKELADAEKSIESVNKLSADLNEFEHQKEVVKKEITVLTEKMTSISNLDAYKNKLSVYDKLSSQIKDVSAKKEELINKLNGNNVSRKELEVCKKCIDELSVLEERKKSVELLIEQLTSAKSQKKDNKPISKILILASILLFVLSIPLFFLHFIVGVSCLVVGVVLLVVKLLINNKTLANKDPINDIISEKRQELVEINAIIENYNHSLKEFLSKFNFPAVNYADAFVMLNDSVSKITEYENTLTILDGQMKALNFVRNEIMDKEIVAYKYDDLATIKGQLNAKNEQYRQLVNKVAMLTSTIKEREQEGLNAVYLSNKKIELVELLDNYKNQLATLKLTQKYLIQADENLKTKYRAPLQNAYDKYLNILTKGMANANIDIDFNVTVNENGQTMSTDYYSKGYKDLFDICKRFALIEVLFEKEKPFIMLDDPFCNLDNEKLNLATTLLKSLSSEYQIIYFICHDSRGVVNG